MEEAGGVATPAALLDVVFHGTGSDTAFGRHFLQLLLAEDPRFREQADGNWSLVVDHALAQPIDETRFVVVDLETTGHHPDEESVTEIGAVLIENGKVIDRFEQLVNPNRPIPPFVTKLTGITDAMVADAPPIAQVMGRFVDFAEGAVLVAHNAAFDAGLLDHQCRRILGRPLGLPTLCTVKLAQRLMPELRRTSLDSLCEHFQLEAASRHRAMGDAEMTGEVLLRLSAILKESGATKTGELLEAQTDPDSPRKLAINVAQSDLEGLPDGPGVYRLIGAEEESLYIARATNVRERVLSFFLSSDHLSDRQLAMISKTYEIVVTACGSELESAIVEADEVRVQEPPYNRSGKHMPKVQFAKISLRGEFPRVFVASRLRGDRALYIGPLRGRGFAQDAVELVAACFGLRTCPGTLRPSPLFEACKLAAAGHCSSPCDASVSPGAYRAQVDVCRDALHLGPQSIRERFGELGLIPGSTQARQFQAASRRLERLAKRGGWLVNDQNYLAAAPGPGGNGLFVACVRGGYCVGTRHVEAATELEGLVSMAAATPTSTGSQELADASTILANWRQAREENPYDLIVDFDPDDEPSISSACQKLAVLL